MATYGYIYDTPWFKEWIGSNPFDHVLKPLMKASNQTNLWSIYMWNKKAFVEWVFCFCLPVLDLPG